MKKLLAFVLVAGSIFLAGCDPKSKNIGGDYVMPEGMKDCTVFKLNPSNGKTLYVVRCPNSSASATYSNDKQNQHVTVVEK